jgi:hypothetical protein
LELGVSISFHLTIFLSLVVLAGVYLSLLTNTLLAGGSKKEQGPEVSAPGRATLLHEDD